MIIHEFGKGNEGVIVSLLYYQGGKRCLLR